MAAFQALSGLGAQLPPMTCDIQHVVRSGANRIGIIRVFDIVSGKSRQLTAGRVTGTLCWDAQGGRFLYAGRGSNEELGLFLAGPLSNAPSLILRGQDLHVLAWDAADRNVISYFRTAGNQKESETGELSDVESIALNGLDNDVTWNVSPDRKHALFFGKATSVVLTDLPFGDRMWKFDLSAF